jgi:hypothetical protein
MWKAVRLCMRLLGSESVENGGRPEKDAFTTQNGGQ